MWWLGPNLDGVQWMITVSIIGQLIGSGVGQSRRHDCEKYARYARNRYDFGEVICAINCGGEEHVAANGMVYIKDPLHGEKGIASDYGKKWQIRNVPPMDAPLYQTERYHTETFTYILPADVNGHYLLVLKFSEVYFGHPEQKVFDVVLNGDHEIVSDLDIFQKVGQGMAYDKYIPYEIQGDNLLVGGEASHITNGRISLEFIKGNRDNPKINAFHVIRGDLEQIRDILAQVKQWEGDHAERIVKTMNEETDGQDEDDEIDLNDEGSLPNDEQQTDNDDVTAAPSSQPPPLGYPSGSLESDPYTTEESSIILPVFIAIGAFIPILFCLCRL